MSVSVPSRSAGRKEYQPEAFSGGYVGRDEAPCFGNHGWVGLGLGPPHCDCVGLRDDRVLCRHRYGEGVGADAEVQYPCVRSIDVIVVGDNHRGVAVALGRGQLYGVDLVVDRCGVGEGFGVECWTQRNGLAAGRALQV